MEEDPILRDLNAKLSKKENIPKWEKHLIIRELIGFFFIILIIVIIAIVSGPSPNPESIGKLECSFEIEDISKETPILNKDYLKSSTFDIIIDGKKVNVVTEYKFGNLGHHNITFLLYEDINMDYMFKDIKQLISIKLFSDKNAKIKSMISTFESCENLNHFSNHGFILDEIKSIQKIFYKTNISSLDLKNFAPQNVEDMSFMFAFSSIEQINLTALNRTHTINMSHMFYSCDSLTSLDDFNLERIKVDDMSYMFGSCGSLSSLNLSNFDIKNVKNMSGIFYNCTSLSKLIIGNFNSENVEDISHMFDNAVSLKGINTKIFNTNNAKNMSYMLNYCNWQKNFKS